MYIMLSQVHLNNPNVHWVNVQCLSSNLKDKPLLSLYGGSTAGFMQEVKAGNTFEKNGCDGIAPVLLQGFKVIT
jgi:hypothetical protein